MEDGELVKVSSLPFAKQFQGQELFGKTLGVVGLGKIGSLVAEMGLKLGMGVIGFDPSLSVDAAWRLSNQVQRIENLPTLLSRSDYVTLHLPFLETTQHFINPDNIRFFKPGVNISAPKRPFLTFSFLGLIPISRAT